MKDRNIAILYDRIPYIGGAEKVVFEVSQLLDAPVYTVYKNPEISVPDDIEIITLKNLKYYGFPYRYLLNRNNTFSRQLDNINVVADVSEACPELYEYDVVLEIGVYSKHYIPAEHQTVINYTITPPRWIYDLYQNRMGNFHLAGISFLIKFYAKVWRVIDKAGNLNVDSFIAISDSVSKRLDAYYNRNSDVVYPPVTGDWRNESDDRYFITWSRLVPNKRMDIVTEAFTELNERILICGDGPERTKIEEIASGHDNIEVKGFVDDIESLVARATAVIYIPLNEDFGLVGAEAMTAGKPLIGVDDGFTRHQITDESGVFVEPTPESIREAIRKFELDDYDSEQIQDIAKKYSRDEFRNRLTTVIERELDSK